ncbi:MAG: hypothetical protein OHK0039_27370 [Bacteroidia bacterium]
MSFLLAISLLPIDIDHPTKQERLPFHHRDPFDRLLIAQALSAGLTILTRDAQVAAYAVTQRWG